MRGIILVAGRGSRLKHLTKDSPKCMVLLHERPLIDYQIQAFLKNDIHEIAVVRGYLKDKIKHIRITQIFDNSVWESTNMLYSLYQADVWLRQYTCVISYGDIFYNKSVVTNLLKSNEDITITYDIHFNKLWSSRFSNPLDDLESFKLDHNSFVMDIGQKVHDIHQVMGQYMGLLKITPQGWKRLKHNLQDQDITDMSMTHALNILAHKGTHIKAIPIEEEWGEVDTISDLQFYEHHNIGINF